MPMPSSLSLLPAPRRAPEKPRYLFLLSHMRSYSSLLSHVLGSSPDIDGYSEMHVRYRNKLDLWRLQHRVRQATGAPLTGRWVLDKILHNYIRPPDRLLAENQVRALIFLREPESAMRSILTLAQRNEQDRRIHTPQFVCDYYVSRLHRLRADGERLGMRALYFDAELLVRQPDKLLGFLHNWLELGSPLDSHYHLFPKSGEAGFGDPSANICSGQILGDASSTIADDVHIPTLMLAEAKAAYQRCRASLLEHCRQLQDDLKPLQLRAVSA